MAAPRRRFAVVVMSIDEQELRALCFLALRVRRATKGAGPWDETGLMTNLRKIQNRSLHMTVEHVLRHAADPNAKSPGVVCAGYTPKAPEPQPRGSFPPKKADECKLHPGQWFDACGPCATDAVDAWHDEDLPQPSPSPPWQPGDAHAGAQLVRAAMRLGREGL